MANLSPRTRLGRHLRSHMTPPEVILWKFIRGDSLGHRVKRQQPYGPYYLDFYISKLSAAIEVDGYIHESSYEHDSKRDAWLATQGIIVIRIPARRIFESMPDVFEYLQVRLADLADQSDDE